MKIKGWEKLSGITYRGRCIINPIHNADETKYYADIIDISLPQNPKWKLTVLVPGFKFKNSDDKSINIILSGSNNISSRVSATKENIKSVKHFRILYESLVEELITMERQQTLYQSTTYNQPGIINKVNNNGMSIDYGKVMQDMINSIKDSNQLIDEIKTEINNL